MTYDMQAEGDNGTHRTTFVGTVDWTHEVTEHGPVVFEVDASQKFDLRPRTGIQCIGAFAPGLTAQGKAGIVGLVINSNPQTVLHETLGITAGVHGQCQFGGTGVEGRGGAAQQPAEQGQPVIEAGPGVVGQGGDPAPATSQFPVLAAGAGIIGLGGGASMPSSDDTANAGVFGAGSPGSDQTPPGRGGVFASASIAQLRLVPAVDPFPPLPLIGRFGDLYVTVTQMDPRRPRMRATMYMCVIEGDQVHGGAWWAPFQLGEAIQAQ